jgi:hypothetical protein
LITLDGAYTSISLSIQIVWRTRMISLIVHLFAYRILIGKNSNRTFIWTWNLSDNTVVLIAVKTRRKAATSSCRKHQFFSSHCPLNKPTLYQFFQFVHWNFLPLSSHSVGWRTNSEVFCWVRNFSSSGMISFPFSDSLFPSTYLHTDRSRHVESIEEWTRIYHFIEMGL